MKKVALVTGASSGIGRSAAIELNNLGFEVYAAARRVHLMDDLKQTGIKAVQLDVTKIDSVQSCIDNIIKNSGRIDVLVNNAGYGLFGTVEETPIDEARKQFEVNLIGLSSVTSGIIPHMRANGGGTIINVSSIGGKIYSPYGAYYHATKHALEGYSDCLRYELKPFNIKVVVIQPGIIQTEWGDIALQNLINISSEGAYGSDISKYARYMQKTYAPGKATTPDVVGRLIARVAKLKRPAPRYAVGKLSGMALIARKVLSDRLFDWALRKQIQIISK
ncbi:MAG: SDR family NAD(P)-dependent oxidoreductase [Bacteroidales bacterium]|nr:SDR family NAD(P)-dependent oxidoreductase [Bacteroidales bacterium]